jgi:hypothetical protein
MWKALKNGSRVSVGANVWGEEFEGVALNSDSDSDSSSSDDDSEAMVKDDTSKKSEGLDEDEKKKRKRELRKEAELHAKKKQERMENNETDTLTKQFKQAVDQVDSFVPVRIANAFNVLETRLRVINESLLTNKTNSLVAWEQVLPAIYYQL